MITSYFPGLIPSTDNTLENCRQAQIKSWLCSNFVVLQLGQDAMRIFTEIAGVLQLCLCSSSQLKVFNPTFEIILIFKEAKRFQKEKEGMQFECS